MIVNCYHYGGLIFSTIVKVVALIPLFTNVTSCEFDNVDRTLFETLEFIAEQEQNFSLWDEPTNGKEFKITSMPVYFIRREENGTLVKAYLINFPSPPASAVEVDHTFEGLGTIHRYDDEMSELDPTSRFANYLDVSGLPIYAMAYKPHNMDKTPLTNTNIPYSHHDGWVRTFIHELFHYYQVYAPDSNWNWNYWGGLHRSIYPVTADNLALTLLERHALMAGRSAGSVSEKTEVLRQILAIRHARTQLPEAVVNKCKISQLSKHHGQNNIAPNGVGQSFIACQDGEINSIRVNVLTLNDPNCRIELQMGTGRWNAGYSQNIILVPGVNIIHLDEPFPVDDIHDYAFGLFSSISNLSLWSDTNQLPGGEAFFINGSTIMGITPKPDLTFELMVEGPNYIEVMDSYQEALEGSAEYVMRKFFVQSGNTVYAQEELEKLERNTRTHTQTSRGQLFSTIFAGGYYQIGSTIMDLLDEVTNIDWKSTFPDGGSPIEVLEELYGPLTQQEIDQLIEAAKQSYDWTSIVSQVAAIPSEYLDSP